MFTHLLIIIARLTSVITGRPCRTTSSLRSAVADAGAPTTNDIPICSAPPRFVSIYIAASAGCRDLSKEANVVSIRGVYKADLGTGAQARIARPHVYKIGLVRGRCAKKRLERLGRQNYGGYRHETNQAPEPGFDKWWLRPLPSRGSLPRGLRIEGGLLVVELPERFTVEKFEGELRKRLAPLAWDRAGQAARFTRYRRQKNTVRVSRATELYFFRITEAERLLNCVGDILSTTSNFDPCCGDNDR